MDKLKVLYVDYGKANSNIYRIVSQAKVVSDILPKKKIKSAERGFDNPQELVDIINDQKFDGVVLDRETFGLGKIRGSVNVLLKYATAIIESEYKGKLVITTTQNPNIVAEEVKGMVPKAKWFHKPLPIKDLVDYLAE